MSTAVLNRKPSWNLQDEFKVIAHRFRHHRQSRNISTAHRLPRIMMWTKHFGSWYGKLNDTRIGEQLVEGCNSNCVITNDRRLLASSDVILFHVRDIEDMPSNRSNKQKWVFFTLESPPNTPFSNFRHMKNMFNWTMTYRSDSDVYLPYGRVVQRNGAVTSRKDLRIIWESKRKVAVWVVSNCQTHGRREAFLRELRRHLQVDVYGSCGLYRCPRYQEDSCYKHFERNYFYMLAFENSICVDYATEKLFIALAYDIVPVVFGGANYSAVAPSNSYIDALAFRSPKHLAEHLVGVSKNYSAYTSYFKWKDSQDVERPYRFFCHLCKKAHNTTIMQRSSSYSDIETWWRGGSRCRRWGV
ncbi:alpha-(1,3)-fucosyltransferase C-like [Amblyomma americanum]